MRSHGSVFWRTYYCKSASPLRLANGFEGFCPFRLYVTIFNRQRLNLTYNNTLEYLVSTSRSEMTLACGTMILALTGDRGRKKKRGETQIGCMKQAR